MALSLNTDAFQPGGAIPSRYTCDGRNVSPPLFWSDVLQGTQAFAIVMDDPDAPGRVFTHWALFNLPADTREVPENVPKTERLEQGALQGTNDFGRVGYGGPCPPPGRPHRYRFFLYALDRLVELGPKVSKQQLLDAIKGHVLAEAELVATYQR